MRSIYLFILATLIGIELSVGAVVAPVIFFADIGDNVLSHFQRGLLMTQIFVKFGYIMLAVSLIVMLYELFYLKQNINFKVKFSCFMLALLNMSLALAFVFYFIDYILAAQKIGEAATLGSAEFASVHKASEYCLKIMMLAQIVLFFLRASQKSAK